MDPLFQTLKETAERLARETGEKCNAVFDYESTGISYWTIWIGLNQGTSMVSLEHAEEIAKQNHEESKKA